MMKIKCPTSAPSRGFPLWYAVLILLMNTVMVVAQQSEFLKNGLVAYYPFNGNANDESGNGHHGVITGGKIVSDRFGAPHGALELNGQGDVVTVPHAEDLNLVADLTFSAWAMIQTPPSFRTAYTILDKRSPKSLNSFPYLFAINYQTGIPTNYAQLLFVTGHANQYQYIGSAGDIVVTNQWLHLVAVIRSNQLKLYLGAIEVASQSLTPNSRQANLSELLIGSGARTDIPAEFFQGKLDDIRIYDRAFSASEVKSLYVYESGFSLGIEVSQVRVTLRLIVGYTYQFQTSLNGSTWIDSGATFLATDSTSTRLFDVTNDSRLYRVVRVP